MLLIATTIGYVAGYQQSISVHGNWFVSRDTNGKCLAFDPDRGVDEGEWRPGVDGRCHLSDHLSFW